MANKYYEAGASALRGFFKPQVIGGVRITWPDTHSGGYYGKPMRICIDKQRKMIRGRRVGKTFKTLEELRIFMDSTKSFSVENLSFYVSFVPVRDVTDKEWVALEKYEADKKEAARTRQARLAAERRARLAAERRAQKARDEANALRLNPPSPQITLDEALKVLKKNGMTMVAIANDKKVRVTKKGEAK